MVFGQGSPNYSIFSKSSGFRRLVGAQTRSSCSAPTFLLFSLLSVACPLLPACAQTDHVLDTLESGSTTSCAAHAVQLTRARAYKETVFLGALTLPISGIQIQPGGSMKARLRSVPAPDSASPELRSVQVTLATSPRDYGKRQSYRITLNGQEVYRTTETDNGGGPARSLFIDLSKPTGPVDIQIVADAASQAPITILALRLHAMPGASARKPASRMGLSLVSPLGNGYQLDEPTIRDTFHKLPRSPYLEGQLAVLYNFCKRTAPENSAEIERLTGLAEKTKIPLRIAFQVHHGGTPEGVSDGANGTFTDLPYQQITFDPADRVEEPGLAGLMGDHFDVRYGLSTPNRFGTAPWLTFNHPRLNQLRRIRLTQALFTWKEARERLLSTGNGRLLPPELSTGDESIYWAKGVDDSKFGDVNGGVQRTNMMADFNPFVVADALKEGVNLDPRDGLNMQEREWLHLNLARQQQRLVDWMSAALPAEPVRLSGAISMFATDLPRRNLFTEPYAMPLFPLQEVSPNRPGLEVGYVQNGRSGGEYWSGSAVIAWLLKERERGRIALPNLDCTRAEEPQLKAALQAAYACGARFATVNNWYTKPTAPKMLKAFADSIESPSGAEFPSVAIGRGAKWERQYVAGSDAWGINRIELYPQEASISAVKLSLKDSEGGEEITVNTSIKSTADSKSVIINLPTIFHQEPGRKYTLTVEALNAPNAAFGVASDIKIAARLSADLKLERIRSETISAIQDARDLLDSLKTRHARSEQSLFAKEALEKAEAEFTLGNPAQAYSLGIRAEQLTLPASFSLPASPPASTSGSRLTPYWISLINPEGPIRSTITMYSPQAATVILKSAVAQKVTVRWGTLETVATLTPNVPAEISLIQVKELSRPPVRRVRKRRAPSTLKPSTPIQPNKPRMGPPVPRRTGPPAPNGE